MSSHPKTHIFSFNLSLNAPWFEKLAFEKNTMYFTLVILQSSIEKTNHVQVIPSSTRTMLCFKYHPKTLLFCELLALTRRPHIFLYFFSHWMPKIMLSPNETSFFEPVLSPNAPACWRAGLTPVSTSYLTAPPGLLILARSKEEGTRGLWALVLGKKYLNLLPASMLVGHVACALEGTQVIRIPDRSRKYCKIGLYKRLH